MTPWCKTYCTTLFCFQCGHNMLHFYSNRFYCDKCKCEGLIINLITKKEIREKKLNELKNKK